MGVDVSKSSGYAVLQANQPAVSKSAAYLVGNTVTILVDKATAYSVHELSLVQRASKSAVYAVLEGDADVNLSVSMSVQYTVGYPDSLALVSESNQYAVLDQPKDSVLVSESNQYAVLFQDVFVSASKIAAYVVEGFDETKYQLVSKGATYVPMRGTAKVSKAAGYAVVNDPTPRWVNVSKEVAYIPLGYIGIRLSKAAGYGIMDATPKPEIRATKETAYCVLENRNPKVFLSEIVTEPLTGGMGQARLANIGAEPLTGGYPQTRLSHITTEAITGGNPEVRCPIIGLEVLARVPEEPSMTSVQFPTQAQLPGLAFNVSKKPNFSTRIAGNSSGKEVRNAFWDDPRWDFELSYELLRDRPVNAIESELKLIAGFFLQRRGSFEQFLFLDTDDYQANNYQGTANGAATTFPMRRSLGGFYERVGQVNTARPVNVYFQVNALAATIPATPGPYTVTVNGGNPIKGDVQVILVSTGEPLQRVGTVSPGAGTYTVTPGSGLYTFNAAQQGQAIFITYQVDVDISSYEVLMPNKLVFDAAPAKPGAAASMDIYANFEFYFVCRFTEDGQDYEKFMEKLWELQSCTFRSVIQ